MLFLMRDHAIALEKACVLWWVDALKSSVKLDGLSVPKTNGTGANRASSRKFG